MSFYSSVVPAFENLPNFRQAGGRDVTNRHGRVVKNGLLYRSSRTDFVTVKDKGIFQQLGIKSIVDLRQKSEYERADGEKLLDDMYEVMVFKKGVAEPWKPSLRWGRRNRVGNGTEHSFFGRRYLVNMFTRELIWHYFLKLNFFLRYFSLVLVAIDWMVGSHLFTKFYNYFVLYDIGITENYVDMLEFSKPVIADILRLMLQDENMPMLIHCAHGKDRTGLIVAAVMGCLEVDDEVIVDDYAKSEEGLLCIKQRVYDEIVARHGFNKENTTAKPDTMRCVLEELQKRYGTVQDYLTSAGFTPDEQQKLRNVFLATDSS